MRDDLRAVDVRCRGDGVERDAVDATLVCKLYFVVTKQGARGRIQRGRYRSELARALEVVPHVPRRRPRALLLRVRLEVLVELHQII